MHTDGLDQDQGDAIAVIGMACRFPGAGSPEQFWHNLRNGVESITFFADEELEASVDPALLQDPDYVKAGSVVDDVGMFDAAFFKFSPREATITDPQQRLLLECAWEVMERVGYHSDGYNGRVGVYAGAEMNSYMLNNLLPNKHLSDVGGGLQIVAGIDRGYLCTRVSYELDLCGPSFTVQSSCSTSLVAVHMACESLLNSECDMALAGGVTVCVPQKVGYLYDVANILSPDGHCRAFDARGRGTIFGNGLGLVVLKRLKDALVDGDCVMAVIRGSAVNNDGAHKIGYMAPSVEGQAAVIAEALSVAGVHPETVTYVEAHGTATELGDPIEITALTQAYRQYTDKRGYCAIGSVKTNVGHLAAASGIAGLIKTVLALRNKEIPPSLHFEHPNPQIDFQSGPFYVNTELCTWKTNGVPRRAGVSSFGMGGTNAHLILEEAPPVAPSEESVRSWRLLLLSAKTASALEEMTDNLAGYLKRRPGLDLADVAYTLQVGRKTFDHRRMLVCRDVGDAVATLECRDGKRVLTHVQEASGRPVVFMFPGLGDQYPNMALGLYRTEPEFRRHVDYCAAFLEPLLGLDLRDVLFPDAGQKESGTGDASGLNLWDMMHPEEAQGDENTQRLNQPSIAYPAVFVIEYALARLLFSWGIRPVALTGYSTGEYVAACLSEVFSLEEALTLIVRRAELIAGLPEGTMLAVPLSEEQVKPFLRDGISLSAVNGPTLCVVSGSEGAIAELEGELREQEILCRRLQTSHAFHSPVMDPILEPFAALVRTTVDLKAPRVPYVSNVTGRWITAEQATDPSYWARHLRQPIRFADGLQTLLSNPDWILLEVGPGHALSALAIQHSHADTAERVMPSLPRPYNQEPDAAFIQGMLGRLWLAGAVIDWQALYREERRCRVLLPTYPFERKRYWIDPPRSARTGDRMVQEPVDRAVLPKKREKLVQFEPSGPRPAPRAGIEKRLADIWQRYLGVEEVDRNDNFFRLGGHSLTAMQIVARVREDFEVDIPLRASFEAPTLAELAERVEDALKQSHGAPATPIVPIDRAGHLPLSLAQEQLWLIEHARSNDNGAGTAGGLWGRLQRVWRGKQASDSGVAYNLVLAVRFVGPLNVEILQRCLDEMVYRHEVLRTTFPSEHGRPVPVISQEPIVPLQVENLVDYAADEREMHVHGLIAQGTRHAFDIFQGPLWRVVLARLHAEDHVLIVSMHPIISDEWSMEVFIRETFALYQALVDGQASPLSDLAIQYSDFAAWQKSWLKKDVWQGQVRYWEERLAGSTPMLRLPPGKTRSPEFAFQKATYQFVFSHTLTKTLRDFSHQAGVTLFTTLLTAFKVLLYHCTGQGDVLVVTPVANREQNEIAELVGRFGNKLALRTEVSAAFTFFDLLRQVQETTLTAYAHQDLPFEILVDKLGMGQWTGGLSLFQVMFTFENRPIEAIQLSGLSLEFLGGNGGSESDLGLSIKDAESGLVGTFTYTVGLFDVDTIARLADDFLGILETISSDDASQLSVGELLAGLDVRASG